MDFEHKLFMRKKFRYLFFILIFLFTAYTLSPSDNANNCHSKQVFIGEDFDGVVVDKFLDKSQHSVPVIVIENFGDSVDRKKIDLFNEKSGLYDKLNKNDRIRKLKNSRDILINERGSFIRLGVADFDCDSAELNKEFILFNMYKLFK